jgi:energy-coupling factor transport system ATP-binding protein
MKNGCLFEEEQGKLISSSINNKKSSLIDKTSPVVELNNYRISFSKTQVLKINELKIFPGEIISLMGPNGSGKTSLLLSLFGLIGFEAKVNQIFGKPITQKKDKFVYKNRGIVFQNPDHQLFCDSVDEEIYFAPKNLYGKDFDDIYIGCLIEKF